MLLKAFKFTRKRESGSDDGMEIDDFIIGWFFGSATTKREKAHRSRLLDLRSIHPPILPFVAKAAPENSRRRLANLRLAERSAQAAREC